MTYKYEQVAGSQMDKQSIAVGNSKGFPVTKRAQKQKPSNRKGAVANAKGDGNKVVRRKVNFVRDLIREVMGLAPYEKRVVELLKLGKEKRALKVAKHRLGGHSRGKAKRDQMAAVLQKQKMTKH